jgi:EmrB/QacA subfamily drug resistance transporter
MDAPASSSTPKPLTHRETMLVVLGVLLPVFMGSLDTTILASALPSIGREFGDIHNLPWLITAYLVANTAVTTLYGKISDIHGRRTTLLISISMYMLGSIVCALAPNMFVLILGRVLHGLGGGGLTSTGMVVLGDIAAPRDRGKYYGYFSATYTTAGASGPVLGGFLAEYMHWSVIFWMNIPLGILAMVLTLTLLKRLPRHEQPHRLDFLGAFLIMTASVAFMLALSMGGVRYPWTSPPILALCAFALIVGAGFVWRLLTAPEPLIPLAFFSNPVTTLAIVANAFGWGAIVGLHIFLPIYLQNVIGMSPLMAGLSVMMLAITLNVSAGVTGTILPRLTHYKVIPIVGLLISIAALMVLAWHAQSLSLIEFEILLALIGIGFGGLPPLSSTVLQNSVPIHTFGTAVATMQFSRNLYCTMMVAAFGAIVLTGQANGGAAAVTEYAAEGFVRIFYAAAASFALALIAVVLVEAKPLQTTHV